MQTDLQEEKYTDEMVESTYDNSKSWSKHERKIFLPKLKFHPVYNKSKNID